MRNHFLRPDLEPSVKHDRWLGDTEEVMSWRNRVEYLEEGLANLQTTSLGMRKTEYCGSSSTKGITIDNFLKHKFINRENETLKYLSSSSIEDEKRSSSELHP